MSLAIFGQKWVLPDSMKEPLLRLKVKVLDKRQGKVCAMAPLV